MGIFFFVLLRVLLLYLLSFFFFLSKEKENTREYIPGPRKNSELGISGVFGIRECRIYVILVIHTVQYVCSSVGWMSWFV